MIRNKYWRRQQGLKRAKRVHQVWCAQYQYFDRDRKVLNRLYKTRTACSCYMCGNPRRHRGELTMQEKRANEDRPDYTEI